MTDENREDQVADAAATRRVSNKAADEARRLAVQLLAQDLDDLKRSGIPQWFKEEIGALLRDADEIARWKESANGMRSCRIKWRRVRVVLVVAADGNLVEIRDDRRR